MLQVDDERRNTEQFKDQVLVSFHFELKREMSQCHVSYSLFVALVPALMFLKSNPLPFSAGGEGKRPNASAEASARGDGGGTDESQHLPQEAAEGAGGCH